MIEHPLQTLARKQRLTLVTTRQRTQNQIPVADRQTGVEIARLERLMDFFTAPRRLGFSGLLPLLLFALCDLGSITEPSQDACRLAQHVPLRPRQVERLIDHLVETTGVAPVLRLVLGQLIPIISALHRGLRDQLGGQSFIVGDGFFKRTAR